MRYTAVVEPEAAQDLAKIFSEVPALRDFISAQLLALCEHPTTLSVRSFFPHIQSCQIFPFHADHEANRHFFRVLFQYGQDEQTIHILAIAHQRKPRADLLTDD